MISNDFHKFIMKCSPIPGVILKEMLMELNDLISNERRQARNQALEEAAKCAWEEIQNDESWRIPETIERLIK